MTLKFFSDPGHGWLQVPLTLLKELGVAAQISSYSYRQGRDAYLEEDVDAGLVLRALVERGTEYHIEEFTTDDYSPIRNYRGY